jgi:hypothetical protein
MAVTEAGISTDVIAVQPLYSLALMLDEEITSGPLGQIPEHSEQKHETNNNRSV